MTNADKKLDAWKKKLLDLGKRNRLLNYHDTKRSNLRIIKPSMLELWNSIVLDEKTIEFPYYEDADTLFDDHDEVFMPQAAIQTNQSIKEQQKTLRNLRNKAKTVMEEQGVNVLYIAFGFLKWTESEQSDYQMTSPIILVPVSLTWESITAPFVLALHEDEIVVNPTLLYKLENDYGITFPDFDMEYPIEQFLTRISELVAHNGWNVSYDVGLNLFSFLKINMYRDLENHRESILANMIIRALCGDTKAIDRSAIQIANEYDHDRLENPMDLFQVVDADSSQQDAILCARKGLSFILQGPPGTGKSQTITNIIAECLADGKKVLFVSEKMAALEVVRRRLESSGLGVFCLTLHSHKANKKEILEQLRNSLDLASKKANLSDEVYQRLQLLQSDREQLNEYAKELYMPVQPLNKTIYEVHGSIANLQSFEDIIFQISDVASTTPEKLYAYIVSLTRFVDTIGKMSDDYKKSPWYGANLGMVTNELRHDIGANVGALIGKHLELSSVLDHMMSSLHLDGTPSYNYSINLLPILRIAANSPVVPAQWMWINDFEPLLKDAALCSEQKTSFLALVCELDNRCKSVSMLDNQVSLPIAGSIHTVDDVAAQILQLQQVIISKADYSIWNHLSDIGILFSCVIDLQKRVGIYNERRSALLKTFEPEVFDVDYKGMLQRFKSEYTSVFKVFNTNYKTDKKTIRGLHREFVKKVEDSVVLSVLAVLRDVDEQRCWIAENEVRLKETLGTYFAAEKTDFENLSTYINAFSEIKVCEALLYRIKSILEHHDKSKTRYSSEFYFEYAGLETDWSMVLQKLSWATEFRKIVTQNRLTHDFTDFVCLNAAASQVCLEYYHQLSSVITSYDKEFSWYIVLFEEPDLIKNMKLSLLLDKLIGCKDGLAQLEEWIDFRNARTNCEKNGLKEYIQTIEDHCIPSNKIVPIFKKRFYRMWLDVILPNYPAVMNFRRRVQENTIAEFSTLDKLQFEIAKARIKQKLINELPSLNHFTSGVDEISVLRRELSKQRKIMPIRKLFQSIPHLVPTLKPCLMMSPLSVSLFLAAESYHFDTVIFDEASQVCTENAIGAISRGTQIIIAGDSHQLPPTNFFNATISDSDFDDEEEEDDTDAYESILDEATLMPERTLLWHYRSRHEHLIAFSNAQIYHNNLITFPSNVDRVPDIGVEFIFVPNGYYDRGGKKGNINEAQRIAELVFEHFYKFPNRSLGVITFGEVQQLAIDSAIRKIRLAKQQFEGFFNEESSEPFFVKNLENVQGDERDTIIFSIGYAKDPSGKMHMNFGPLSKRGGERRLNVAITRAKFNVKLVSSIRATDIEVDRINTDGPKLLRYYIDYAMNGPQTLISQISETDLVEHDSPFEEAVYNFLDRKGYKLGTQVGCSGYRIDMAVKHPTINGRYVLGVECDGAAYHSARTARERDRLRQSVLEDMGWKIYRIWSTDWIKDPITEGRKLIETIELSFKEYDAQNADQSGCMPESYQCTITSPADFLSIDTKEVSRDSQLNPYGLMQFQITTFANVPRDSYGYVKATDCIVEVVKTEYPVHYEILCQRLACIFGNEKATVMVRREVDYALDKLKGKVIRKGDFFYPHGYTEIPIRTPNIRKINHISNDELEQAMLTIVRKCIGTTADGLIAETTRVYGFNRAGTNITEAMNLALKNLLTSGQLKTVDGKINVTKRSPVAHQK